MEWLNDYANKIIQGDCLDVMRGIPDKSIDLVVTDPPYGIGVAKKQTFGGAGLCKNTIHKIGDWDNKIPAKEFFDEIFRISKNQVICGGNYFTEYLTNSSCWLVWDKKNDDNKFADCELIWTSFKRSVRIFRYLWKGMLQEDMKNKETRFHPTQKPVALMEWILKNYSTESDIILDCFSGSGSTLVASQKLGRKFIGIEIDSDYCEIASQRLRQQILI